MNRNLKIERVKEGLMATLIEDDIKSGYYDESDHPDAVVFRAMCQEIHDLREFRFKNSPKELEPCGAKGDRFYRETQNDD